MHFIIVKQSERSMLPWQGVKGKLIMCNSFVNFLEIGRWERIIEQIATRNIINYSEIINLFVTELLPGIIEVEYTVVFVTVAAVVVTVAAVVVEKSCVTFVGDADEWLFLTKRSVVKKFQLDLSIMGCYDL